MGAAYSAAHALEEEEEEKEEEKEKEEGSNPAGKGTDIVMALVAVSFLLREMYSMNTRHDAEKNNF